MLQNPWRIEMLGGLRACREGREPVVLSRQQTGSLFAYLALYLNRSHTREGLQALIWPEDAPEVARHKLRQSLYALRRQLQSNPSDEKDIFLTTRDTIQLDPSLFTTDLIQFDQALHAVTHASDISERIQLLNEAVRLYHGELLPGFYAEAFEAERRRLAELHRGALLTLMHAYEERRDMKRAIETGCRVVALDPLMEEAHCDLMRLYAADGQPSAVLRQFQELTSILKQELGEAPSQATRLLMDTLRQAAQANAAVYDEVSVAVAARFAGIERPVDVPDSSRSILTVARPMPPAPNRRGHFLSALTILSVALCFLLAWQAVGGRKGHVAGAEAVPPALGVDSLRPAVRRQSSLLSSPPVSHPADNREVTVAQPSASTTSFAPARSESGVWLPVPSAPSNSRPLIAMQPPPTLERVASQKILWTAHYEPETGDKSSEAVAVTIDLNGNVYVTGFVDTIDHDVDYLTLKYDHQGNLLWQRRYNGPGNDVDRAVDIAVDRQGNVYVTGESDNGKGNGATRLAGLDMATIKYDAEGNEVWVRRYNGPDDGEDSPVRLLVNENGIYVLGRSWGRGKTGNAGFNYVLVKYDPEGVKKWDYRYDGGQGDDEPVDMARDRDGSISITGRSRAEPASGPEFDMLTLRLSKAGVKLWEARYGENDQADDYPCGIGLDRGGNVYVIGTGRGLPGTPDASRAGCLTIKYDAKGKRLWVRGTLQEQDRIEKATLARVTAEGDAIICGLARDENGHLTCRVVERDMDGLPRWTVDVANLAGDDGANAVAVSSNNIYLCGGLQRMHTIGDIGFCSFQYDYNGKLIWQEFLDKPRVWGRARGISVYQSSMMVVGQTDVGKTHQMVIVQYHL